MTTEESIKRFGVADINKWWDDNVAPHLIDKREIVMFVMGMASDAQVEIEYNMHEQARRTLNRQKWVIAHKLS